MEVINEFIQLAYLNVRNNPSATLGLDIILSLNMIGYLNFNKTTDYNKFDLP